MQVDLCDFLSHLAGVVTMPLEPVAFAVFLTMPSTFHHHAARHPLDLRVCRRGLRLLIEGRPKGVAREGQGLPRQRLLKSQAAWLQFIARAP